MAFDRTNPVCRSLKQSYHDLGVRLGQEATEAKGVLHTNYYPNFGVVTGERKRFILKNFETWQPLLRDSGQQIFRFSFDVEQLLINILAVEDSKDYYHYLSVVQVRKEEVDRLLRAVYSKISHFQHQLELDTAEVYTFCNLVEKSSLFLQYTSIVLLSPPQNQQYQQVKVGLNDNDWEMMERLDKGLPLQNNGNDKRSDQFSSHLYQDTHKD